MKYIREDILAWLEPRHAAHLYTLLYRVEHPRAEVAEALLDLLADGTVVMQGKWVVMT